MYHVSWYAEDFGVSTETTLSGVTWTGFGASIRRVKHSRGGCAIRSTGARSTRVCSRITETTAYYLTTGSKSTISDYFVCDDTTTTSTCLTTRKPENGKLSCLSGLRGLRNTFPRSIDLGSRDSKPGPNRMYVGSLCATCLVTTTLHVCYISAIVPLCGPCSFT